jgi:spermidine synthase
VAEFILKVRMYAEKTNSKQINLLILSCFFLSGAAGLIYEILWVRMIDKVIGSAPFAVAAVLTVFMAGLALGSYLAGKTIDRIPVKESLLSLYGKLEVAIGIYGLLLPMLIVMIRPVYSFAYNHLFQSFWIYQLFTFFGCTLLLILPASLMGATLPILCRYYVTHLNHLGTRTGRLYGINTVGAAVGAFLTGFFLINRFGVWGAIFLAAGINFLVGILCILMGRKTEAPDLHPDRPKAENTVGPASNWAVWIFAVSGFCAMAYEVIWTRLLGLIIGPTTYSFTLVVATVIIGLAAGSLIFGWLGDRIKGIFSLLIATQIGAALLALLVSQFLGNSQFFFAKLIYSFQDYFGGMILAQSLVVCIVLLGPTLLLGATFPLVNKIYARSLSSIGSAIGTAYALNTIGAILGSFAAGFVLIPFLGKESGLRVVFGFQFAFALMAWGIVGIKEKGRASLLLPISGIALGTVLFLNFPSWNRQLLSFGRYHNFKNMENDIIRSSWFKALWQGQKILQRYETGREIVFYGDGIGGFTTVEKLTDSLGTVKYTLLNSGKPDASSHGDRSTQTLLAHVPLMFHANPKNVMVLGLASGMTAGEVLYYPVNRMDVLEINEQVANACEFFRPWNNDCLSDLRSRIIIQDGRNHLSLTRETYDVIISEPSNPWMAGLANLYTVEFFKAVRGRLRENGIFVQWIHSYEMDWPTFAMAGRTFREVFPDSLLMATLTGVGDYLLVGFNGQKGFDLGVARKNFAYSRQSRNMSLPDPRLLYHLIISEDLAGLFAAGPLHTDNWPRLEFAAPKKLNSSDSAIEERLSQGRHLSRQSRDIVEASSHMQSLIDMVEFSASVFCSLFEIVDTNNAAPDQMDRYIKIIDEYCNQTPVESYDSFPEPVLRQRCADLQVSRIRRHLSLNPDDAPAHFRLGLALTQIGDTDAAIAAFQKAVALDPFHAKAYNSLGVAYQQSGEHLKAQKAFFAALSINPSHAKAYFNLAQIALQQGKRDEAIQFLREGLQYEENPQAKRLLQQVLLSD